ncbi:MAG: hypothetical protein HY581_09770 [Nitrospirae bacterium]|nr:hypothetical protein [Nitrospirota bacterium]
MAHEQAFWPVECEQGEPDLLVCMSCLSEVFRRKVPMPDCPTCHGVSTYEAFTLKSIQEWGSEALIAKAVKAEAEVEPAPPQPGGFVGSDTAE